MELTKKEQFALAIFKSLLKPLEEQDPEHTINMAIGYTNDFMDSLHMDKGLSLRCAYLEDDSLEDFVEDEDLYEIDRSVRNNPYALMFSPSLGGSTREVFKVILTRNHPSKDFKKNTYVIEQVGNPDRKFEITSKLIDKYFK